MKSSLYLLFVIGLFAFTVDTIMSARTEIQAANPCYAPESGLFALGFLRVNKDSIQDSGCEQIEAARMATELGMTKQAKYIVCNHAGSVSVFGDANNCMRFDGNTTQAAALVNDRHDYCKGRSRKWYRKLSFTGKSLYKKCMRGEA